MLYQNNKLKALYSTKQSTFQQKYTNTERECLEILKRLKHFGNIIYGTNVIVKKDYANLSTLTEIQFASV